MLKSLFLALSLVPSLVSADTSSGDITISIAQPMMGLALPWDQSGAPTSAQHAQIQKTARPFIPLLRNAADSVISVILRNCASHDVHLWKEDRPEGYSNVGFIFTFNDGQKISVKRVHHGMLGGAPIFYLLHPQEEMVLSERPFDPSWNWTPEELHTLAQHSSNTHQISGATEATTVTITPVYSVHDDSNRTCKLNQIWTGAIHGKDLKFFLKASDFPL